MNIDELLASEVSDPGTSEAVLKLGGKEVKLFASRITPKDIDLVSKTYPEFMSKMQPGGLVSMIIRKAKLADGTQAFGLGHHAKLSRVSMDKIGKLFGELFGEDISDIEEDPEDRAKN